MGKAEEEEKRRGEGLGVTCSPKEARELVKNFCKRKPFRFSDILYAIVIGLSYGIFLACLVRTPFFWFGVAYAIIGLLLSYIMCKEFTNKEGLQWFLLIEAFLWPLALLLTVIVAIGLWLKDVIAEDDDDD